MKRLPFKSRIIRLSIYLLASVLLNLSACSTTEVSAPTAIPPSYSTVPHPESYDLAGLKVLLQGSGMTNDPNFIPNCDQDFKKLKSLANSTDELDQGVSELIRNDPIHFHWCFYGKLSELTDQVQAQEYIDQKQKIVLDTFEFLVPVARAFMSFYHDSRYLRWAVKEYSAYSEHLFYRKLELTTAGTIEFAQPTNPFGLWRMPADAGSVLEKYSIVKTVIPPELPPSVGASPTPKPFTAPQSDLNELIPRL